MTLSPWIIYLWGIADSIDCTLGMLMFISMLAALGTTCFYLAAVANSAEEIKDAIPIKTVWIVFTLLTLGQIAAPSSKTIAVMVVAPAIINSEPIQKDLPELYKAAKDALMSTLTK